MKKHSLFVIPVSADTKPCSFLFPHSLLERLEDLHDPSVAAIQIYTVYLTLNTFSARSIVNSEFLNL